jgi:transposase-like protein
MTEDDVLFGYRLQPFALAARTSVAHACRTFGVHRSTYYAWKRQVDRHGLEMLRPRERRRPQMPNQLPKTIEQRIVAFSIPGLGPKCTRALRTAAAPVAVLADVAGRSRRLVRHSDRRRGPAVCARVLDNGPTGAREAPGPPAQDRGCSVAWNSIATAALLPFHRCRSEPGAARALADARSSSEAGVGGLIPPTLATMRKRPGAGAVHGRKLLDASRAGSCDAPGGVRALAMHGGYEVQARCRRLRRRQC